MNIVDLYNLNNFNLDTLDENKINHYNHLMKHKYISYCKNAVIHSKKLEFYNIFENHYKTSHYLDHKMENTERKALIN